MLFSGVVPILLLAARSAAAAAMNSAMGRPNDVHHDGAPGYKHKDGKWAPKIVIVSMVSSATRSPVVY